MEVPCDEGLANHIGPESCVGGREAVGEALTGVRAGQPLSGERLHVRSADAIQSAEGDTGGAPLRVPFRLRAVGRPWHVRTSLFGKQEVCVSARTSRGAGRMVKAGGRRP